MTWLRLESAPPASATAAGALPADALPADPLLVGDGRLPCPDCAAERTFEAPVCEDGHGRDCPDLACVACGAALLLCRPAPIPPQMRRALRGAA